jgi:hypothetical protein
MNAWFIRDLAVISNQCPALAESLRGIDGVSDILRWAATERIPVARMVIIDQDEYSHDLILPWQDNFLVFQLAPGVITGITVCSEKPYPAELLKARIAKGWRPTPTALQDGTKVLGYAACLAA